MPEKGAIRERRRNTKEIFAELAALVDVSLDKSEELEESEGSRHVRFAASPQNSIHDISDHGNEAAYDTKKAQVELQSIREIYLELKMIQILDLYSDLSESEDAKICIETIIHQLEEDKTFHHKILVTDLVANLPALLTTEKFLLLEKDGKIDEEKLKLLITEDEAGHITIDPTILDRSRIKEQILQNITNSLIVGNPLDNQQTWEEILFLLHALEYEENVRENGANIPNRESSAAYLICKLMDSFFRNPEEAANAHHFPEELRESVVYFISQYQHLYPLSAQYYLDDILLPEKSTQIWNEGILEAETKFDFTLADLQTYISPFLFKNLPSYCKQTEKSSATTDKTVSDFYQEIDPEILASELKRLEKTLKPDLDKAFIEQRADGLQPPPAYKVKSAAVTPVLAKNWKKLTPL